MATPLPNYKPIVDPSNATPIGFPDTSQLVATPSNLFGKFNPPSSLRTPLTLNKQKLQNPFGSAQTPTSSAFRNVIPLSFSAANTPVVRTADALTPSPLAGTPSPSRNINDPSSSPLDNPNPAAMVSFFRQRSAHLSSPIFCDPVNLATTSLCSPVVRANPLAESDVAAAALPPTVTPLHVADLDFSLECGFDREQGSVNLDLGVRAARVPVPYAIRLRLVDRKGPIRPIEARIQRLLEGPQSMFLSVIDPNNATSMSSLSKSLHKEGEDESTIESLGNDEDAQDSGENDDDKTCVITDDTFHAFWAAPDTFTSTGCGRLLISVTDSEYTDYEIPINVSVKSTRPNISVVAPGYAHREIRTETNVTFSDYNRDSDVLITVWNETEGDAPLLLNIVLEDNAGGAFEIGKDSDDMTDCIPILLKAGRCEAFHARFSMRPNMTLRRCYYGSVLIKYAFMLQGQSQPGHDLELNQYYDHVINLTGSFSSSNANPASGRPSMDSIVDDADLHNTHEDECICSENGNESPEGCSPGALTNDSHDFSISTSQIKSANLFSDTHTGVHDLIEGRGQVEKLDAANTFTYSQSGQLVTVGEHAESTAHGVETSSNILLQSEDNQATAAVHSENAIQETAPSNRLAQPQATGYKSSEKEKPKEGKKAGRPKLKMPQRVRENGILLASNQGTVELPLLNATPEVVEVSINVETNPKDTENGKVTTTVTPGYLVIGANEKAHLTMMRTTSESSECLVVLRASTMGANPGRATYRVPAHVEQSVMRMERSWKFSVDRPTMSFYNPCSAATREWAVRLRNGTTNAERYHVWISEGCGALYNSRGRPAFRLVSPSEGIVEPESFTPIRVVFDGEGDSGGGCEDDPEGGWEDADDLDGSAVDRGELVRHFHGRLNVRVGAQRDFMPLFGFTGGSDIRLRSTELGFVCARNAGSRHGFVVITGPEADAESNAAEKAVLAPGEEREFVAPYGTGSVVFTGDEIARSRQRRAESLRRLDDGYDVDLDDSAGICGGEFDGEDLAYEAEGLDWSAEDKFSMFYSGRLLDHNMKRFVYDRNDATLSRFTETNRASQCGWAVSVEDGYLHLENLEVQNEVRFEADGAEPASGVIAPLGDAMLSAFRESVTIRAQGRTESVHIDLLNAG